MTERTPIDELPAKLMRIADGALEFPDDEAVVRDAADAIVRLRALAKRLSDTLLKVAPLGGSECFRRFGDDYYADTDWFARRIQENHGRLHEALKRAVLAERAAEQRGNDGPK